MKKIFKYIVPSLFAAGGLYLCGVFVLFVMGAFFEVTFDNIWLAGFYVAIIAAVILAISAISPIVAEALDKRKKRNNNIIKRK